jgi:hypothetical protein
MQHTDALCEQKHPDCGLDHCLRAATLAGEVSTRGRPECAKTYPRCSTCYQMKILKKGFKTVRALHLVTIGMQ